MSTVRRWLDTTLWGPETGARLLVAHMGLSALIAARVSSPAYHRLAELPDALFDPVPFLAWLGGMPPAGVILAVQILGVVAGLAALARRHVRVTFALAWICLLVLAGLRGSRGKVLHNDLLLLWASAPFLLAPVEVTIRDRIPSRLYGWCIRAGIVITALVYFFAGYHKLRRSGIDWVFGDNMTNIMRWGPSIGGTPFEEAAVWIADHRWAAVATAAGILAVEVTLPLVLVWRRLLPLYAIVIVGLHAGTWVVLGLDYWGWAITVPLLFIDWPAVVDRVRERRPPGVAADTAGTARVDGTTADLHR